MLRAARIVVHDIEVELPELSSVESLIGEPVCTRTLDLLHFIASMESVRAGHAHSRLLFLQGVSIFLRVSFIVFLQLPLVNSVKGSVQAQADQCSR